MEVDFAALQSGSESAWNQAFHLLYPRLHHAVRIGAPGLSDSEAEDIAIETLESLVTRVRDLAGWGDLHALAMTIAVRRAISKMRQNTTAKRGSGRVTSLEGLQEATEGNWEPRVENQPRWTDHEIRELQSLLAPALAQLDPVALRLVLGFVQEGKSYRDLSDELNLPIGTIGVMLSRSLRKIRTQLEKSPRLLKEIDAFWR